MITADFELGLRTFDISPLWPEEANRQWVGRLARYHFAPTQSAAENLLREIVASNATFVSGPTVRDAALTVRYAMAPRRRSASDVKHTSVFQEAKDLMTIHRRERFETPIEMAFRTMAHMSREDGFNFFFRMHPNPNVRDLASSILGAEPRIALIEPLEFDELIYVQEKARLVVTDSSGIVERSAALSKAGSRASRYKRTRRSDRLRRSDLVWDRHGKVGRSGSQVLLGKLSLSPNVSLSKPFWGEFARRRFVDFLEQMGLAG